jgi:hypothetical protein
MAISKKFNIISRKEDKSAKLAEKYADQAIKKLESFYNISVPKINIELIYSRKDFNAKLGCETPDWLVGCAAKGGICIFSPSVIEKESNHKKQEIKKLLTHEICHIFNGKINKDSLRWINEGIALFLAKQEKNKEISEKESDFFFNNFFDKNIELEIFAKNNGYKISYWAVRTIAKKFGNKKLLELIKINPAKKNFNSKISGLRELIKSSRRF